MAKQGSLRAEVVPEISRSSLYYQQREWLAEDLVLMRLIDDQHPLTPVFGSRRMTVNFNRRGYPVNRKRVRRLKQELGHYFTWYNQERPHQGLDDATPDEVYFPQPLTQAA